jgi:hypothetical protein
MAGILLLGDTIIGNPLGALSLIPASKSTPPPDELVQKGRYDTILGRAGDSEIMKRSRDDIARLF